MSTDTEVAEQQVEGPQVKPTQRTYFSHNRTYIIPRVKPVERLLANNKVFVENKSEYDRFLVEFKGGFLTTRPGQLVCPNPETGEPEDLVTFLENHPRFGTEFFLQEEQAPDPTEAISRMAECLATGDGDGLIALYEHEKANWARPQVLEPILAAKAKLEEE